MTGGQGVGPFVSLETPLGVGRLERDALSHLIYGARISVVVVLSTVALSAAVGAGLGLAAGYSGAGWTRFSWARQQQYRRRYHQSPMAGDVPFYS